MRTFILISMMVFSGMVFGQTVSNETLMANQHKASLTHFTETVADASILPSATGCPVGGVKLIPGKEESGSMMSAQGKVEKLAALALAQAKSFHSAALCGSCKQVLAATPFVISRPAKNSYNSFCENRPVVNFEADFQSDKDLENYTEAILKKKNAEGQRLYAGCPDPCTFSVYAGKRTLANGKVRSTMTVSCGQPRNTSPLFAKYNYASATALQWSCQK